MYRRDVTASDVSFVWEETEPDRPAHDVLARLIALTDVAYDDGDLSAFLLERAGDREWRGTLRLPSGLRTSYQLCPARDEPLRGRHPDDERWGAILAAGVPDPTNPLALAASCTYGNPGPASILELPGALPQPWHRRRPDVAAGDATRHELEGSVVVVHAPHVDAHDGSPLPVAVLLDGGSWLALDVGATFDNLIADGAVAPLLAVLVVSIHGSARFGPTRVRSLTRPDVLLPFLHDELMPFVAAHWDVTTDPARTVLVGQSLGGLAATNAALAAPHRFGAVVGQSSSLWWPGGTDGELVGAELIQACARRPAAPVRFFLEAGVTERDVLTENRRLRDVLDGRGYDLTYREYAGGHDYACWRGGLADGLVTLLPR
jgi:enterochelin esterase-like enzyme